MEKLFESAPNIIAEAAKSPLGIFALMILAISVLGFFFFRRASERTRAGMFVLLIVGVASFGYATFSNSSRKSSPETGSALGKHGELGSSGGGARPEGELRSSTPRVQGPLSTDRDRPTPLVSNAISGSGVDRERVQYFCSFSGGPGEIKVTFDFTGRAMTEMAEITLFDEDFRKLDSILIGVNKGDSAREIRRIQLSRPQKVIVEIDLDCKGGTAGTFLFRVEGAVQS
jgi:hypothetical protein